MNTPRTGTSWTENSDEIERLRASNQRLREALYPYLPEHDIAYSSSRGFALGTRCPCTDCLKARAALASKGAK